MDSSEPAEYRHLRDAIRAITDKYAPPILLSVPPLISRQPSCGRTQLLLHVSSAVSGELLTRYGTDERRREWLPRMACGDTKVAFAITEPDAGSNTRQVTTTATRDGDDYLLNGTKYYISGVDEAAALIVVARSAPEKLSLFLVPPTRLA